MDEPTDLTADPVIPTKDYHQFYMTVPRAYPEYLAALHPGWSCGSHCACPMREYLERVKIVTRDKELSDIKALRSHLVNWLCRKNTASRLADFERGDGTILQDLLKKACHLCLT
jgi:hypothetical protein